MHFVLTFNAPKVHAPPSPIISTELSLASTTFQSQSKKKKTCISNNEKQLSWGCLTSLELYSDPWKIKKVLTKSDVGRLNRLLLRADVVENLMLPVLGTDAERDAKSGMGAPVSVWDVDTMSMHSLVLKRWASFQNFVLLGGWSPNFVRRRELKKGDEVGFLWDSYSHCFHFKLFK